MYVGICLISAIAGGLIGQRKGSSYPVWFLISGVLPILGPIGALLYRHETEESLRRCPGCDAVIRVHDAMCMRCGTDLDFPADDEIIDPDPSVRVRAKL
jgi:hypothetical protein